jgi:hypothetical protein
MGRGMPYKRKICHITIVVSEMAPNEIKKKKKQAKTGDNVAEQKAAV